MADEWIVRVDGKEYGPVDLESLREWQDEGRLIPANPVRKSPDGTWITAAEIPGIFPVVPPPDVRFRRRSLVEVIVESCGIYRRGFPQFFCLALLVALPSFLLKLSLAYVDVSENAPLSGRALTAAILAVVSLVGVMIAWPFFVGGLQIATSDLAAGRQVRLRDILRRAASVWTRVARLCIAVYGSYLFWTAAPVLAILGLVGALPSVGSVFLALLILAFQVYMAGRLFVNFMFWQQTSVLDGLDGVEALRESKELARSRPRAARLQRPLYRGAILASLWMLLLLALSSGAEIPLVMWRLQGITNLEEARNVMQNLMSASAPDPMTIASYVLSSVIHAALRPLLGISFVLLYFDAKADLPSSDPSSKSPV
jgi:hypothetical protein